MCTSILDNLSRALDTRDREMVGAQEPSPLAAALHADLKLVAEPDRTLVQGNSPTSDLRRRKLSRASTDLSAAITTWAEHWNHRPTNRSYGKRPPTTFIAKSSTAAGEETLHQIKSTDRALVGSMIRANTS